MPKKRPGPQPPLPLALVFTPRQWPRAVALHRALGLPPWVLDLTCYVKAGEGPEITLFDQLPEAPPRDDEEVWEALITPLTRLLVRDDDFKEALGEAGTGCHNRATVEQVGKSLESDGYRIVLLGEELHRMMADTPDKASYREQERNKWRELQLEGRPTPVQKKFVAWLDTGKGELDAENLAAVHPAGLAPLPAAVEHWGDYEQRQCSFFARQIRAGGEYAREAYRQLCVHDAYSVRDRFGLLLPRLERAGMSKDEILCTALGCSSLSSAGIALLEATQDLDRLRAVGQFGYTGETWIDVVLEATEDLGAVEHANRVTTLLDREPALASPVGLNALLQLDKAQAPRVARCLSTYLETAKPESVVASAAFNVAKSLLELDDGSYDAVYTQALEAGSTLPGWSGFSDACGRNPSLAIRWLLANVTHDYWTTQLAKATDLIDQGITWGANNYRDPLAAPTADDLKAFVSILKTETDPTRSKAVVVFLKKFGIKARPPAAPRTLADVDVTTRVSLDSAVIRVFDEDAFGDDWNGDDTALLKLVTTGRGIAFSTAEDGTFSVHVTGRLKAPKDAALSFGLTVKSGRVKVLGEGGGTTLLAPKGKWRATVVRLGGQGKLPDFRVHLDTETPSKRKVTKLDVLE